MRNNSNNELCNEGSKKFQIVLHAFSTSVRIASILSHVYLCLSCFDFAHGFKFKLLFSTNGAAKHRIIILFVRSIKVGMNDEHSTHYIVSFCLDFCFFLFNLMIYHYC